MQKVVNFIALLSGAVSLAVVGAGGYVYLNKDALIDKAKSYAQEAITGALSSNMPSVDLQSSTGPAVPNIQALPK